MPQIPDQPGALGLIAAMVGTTCSAAVFIVRSIVVFQPIGGKIAAFILILGITGAALSTIFPIILIAPWLICDYSQRPRNIRSPLFRILGLIGLLFGFGLQFMDQRPPAMMIFSQGFQALILPAVTLPILLLINQEPLMGSHTASTKMNIGIVCVLIFALVTSYFAIVDLF